MIRLSSGVRCDDHNSGNRPSTCVLLSLRWPSRQSYASRLAPCFLHIDLLTGEALASLRGCDKTSIGIGLRPLALKTARTGCTGFGIAGLRSRDEFLVIPAVAMTFMPGNDETSIGIELRLLTLKAVRTGCEAIGMAGLHSRDAFHVPVFAFLTILSQWNGMKSRHTLTFRYVRRSIRLRKNPFCSRFPMCVRGALDHEAVMVNDV